MKYSIMKKEFYAELISLGEDEGTYTGWGRFIKTDNRKLIDFFNEYLAIEHENITEPCYAVGAYFDDVYDFWLYGQPQAYYVQKFDNLIKEAIANKGMYKGFGNSF